MWHKQITYLSLLTVLPLAGCAKAPLYTGNLSKGAVTYGEIPRDAVGEPVWSAIGVPLSQQTPDPRQTPLHPAIPESTPSASEQPLAQPQS